MASEEPDQAVLVLRLAGPLQSWGRHSTFHRHDTHSEPTKSGVIGLLAAAAGRPREADITDLCDLRLGVRADQPGSLLRDYHTVSDYRGRPLPTATRTAKGTQKPTAPTKYTHVTQRYYLQDAVFVAAVAGPRPLISSLAEAVRNPGFPLALGRRACVPTQPLLLGVDDGPLEDVLSAVPWQATDHVKRHVHVAAIDLATTVGDQHGDDVVNDVPVSFNFADRRLTTRRVRHTWITVETGVKDAHSTEHHDPFTLLGW
ncbi:MAG TPA: type I-E CRISPR-associated protein Cas5/CasD [Pseudonocardiaceae bacterium]